MTSSMTSQGGLKVGPLYSFINETITQLQFDLRYIYIYKTTSQIMQKKIHGDDIIDDITGWLQSFPLYSCLGEVGSGSKL